MKLQSKYRNRCHRTKIAHASRDEKMHGGCNGGSCKFLFVDQVIR